MKHSTGENQENKMVPGKMIDYDSLLNKFRDICYKPIVSTIQYQIQYPDSDVCLCNRQNVQNIVFNPPTNAEHPGEWYDDMIMIFLSLLSPLSSPSLYLSPCLSQSLYLSLCLSFSLSLSLSVGGQQCSPGLFGRGGGVNVNATAHSGGMVSAPTMTGCTINGPVTIILPPVTRPEGCHDPMSAIPPLRSVAY